MPRVARVLTSRLKESMSVAQSDAPDPPGEISAPHTLFGFEILGHLARGAGSVLYYAQGTHTNDVHVLKHVSIQTPRDKRYYQQLRTEFLLGRRLGHPGLRRARSMHIRRSWSGGVTEAALILELCQGNTLEEYFPTDTTQRICIFVRAAMAVAALNDYGYVHCDLKPGNILVTADSHAMVIDLGQACRIGVTKERIQGTPNYMAPEQARRGAMTPKTDVFCFGATMYTTLTGKQMPTLMTAGRGENSLMIDDWIPAPHTIDASIPPDLSLLVMDCVRTNMDRRPADMHEVVARLSAAGMNEVRRVGV